MKQQTTKAMRELQEAVDMAEANAIPLLDRRVVLASMATVPALVMIPAVARELDANSGGTLVSEEVTYARGPDGIFATHYRATYDNGRVREIDLVALAAKT